MKKTLSIVLAMALCLTTLSGCLANTPTATTSAPGTGETAPSQTAQTPGDGVRVFKFGNAGAIAEPAAIICQQFSNKLNERLGGEIIFQFYPAEQLGNEVTMLENLQVNLQQCVMTALDTLSNYAPDLSILSMAFAFKSHDDVYKYLQSDLAKGGIWDKLESQGIHVVSFHFKKNPRIFFGKKPFYTPADMKGVKYRIPNIPMYEKNAKAMGAIPTVVSWSEYPFALMQGVVDAGECSKEAFRSAGLYESCKYVSEVNYAYPMEQLAFSTEAWNSLTPEQQKIIEDTAEECAQEFNETINNKWEEDKKWLGEEGGVTFVDFDKQAFLDAAAPLAAELEAEGFFETPELYEKIQEMLK